MADPCARYGCPDTRNPRTADGFCRPLCRSLNDLFVRLERRYERDLRRSSEYDSEWHALEQIEQATNAYAEIARTNRESAR